MRIEWDDSGWQKKKQKGLIDHVIEASRLDVGTVNCKASPTEAKFLVKDVDGEIAHGDFRYSIVVGILFNLSGHSQTSIAFAVNCAAHYMIYPNIPMKQH